MNFTISHMLYLPVLEGAFIFCQFFRNSHYEKFQNFRINLKHLPACTRIWNSRSLNKYFTSLINHSHYLEMRIDFSDVSILFFHGRQARDYGKDYCLSLIFSQIMARFSYGLLLTIKKMYRTRSIYVVF